MSRLPHVQDAGEWWTHGTRRPPDVSMFHVTQVDSAGPLTFPDQTEGMDMFTTLKLLSVEPLSSCMGLLESVPTLRSVPDLFMAASIITSLVSLDPVTRRLVFTTSLFQCLMWTSFKGMIYAEAQEVKLPLTMLASEVRASYTALCSCAWESGGSWLRGLDPATQERPR